MSDRTTPFTVRAATRDDASILARQRIELYRDLGQLPEATADPLLAAARRYFEHAIASGEFHGWLASPSGGPGEIIAGAGLRLRAIAPRPGRKPGEVSAVPQGLVTNVFTERTWRRQGAGALVLRHVIDWARANHLASLVLHASSEGRPLYEKLGFEATNEMRYTGEL